MPNLRSKDIAYNEAVVRNAGSNLQTAFLSADKPCVFYHKLPPVRVNNNNLKPNTNENEI